MNIYSLNVISHIPPESHRAAGIIALILELNLLDIAREKRFEETRNAFRRRQGANPLCALSELDRLESTLFVVPGHIKAFVYEAKSTGRCYAGGRAEVRERRGGDRETEHSRGCAEEGNGSSSSGGGGGGIVFHCTAFNCIPKWLCAKSSPSSPAYHSRNPPPPTGHRRRGIFSAVNPDKLNRRCRFSLLFSLSLSLSLSPSLSLSIFYLSIYASHPPSHTLSFSLSLL